MITRTPEEEKALEGKLVTVTDPGPLRLFGHNACRVIAVDTASGNSEVAFLREAGFKRVVKTAWLSGALPEELIG